MARRLVRALKSDSGQIGSAGVAAAVIPTAVLGTQISADTLPATGIAVGMYVMIAIACITAGMLMRWQAARFAKKAR